MLIFCKLRQFETHWPLSVEFLASVFHVLRYVYRYLSLNFSVEEDSKSNRKIDGYKSSVDNNKALCKSVLH